MNENTRTCSRKFGVELKQLIHLPPRSANQSLVGQLLLLSGPVFISQRYTICTPSKYVSEQPDNQDLDSRKIMSPDFLGERGVKNNSHLLTDR